MIPRPFVVCDGERCGLKAMPPILRCAPTADKTAQVIVVPWGLHGSPTEARLRGGRLVARLRPSCQEAARLGTSQVRHRVTALGPKGDDAEPGLGSVAFPPLGAAKTP